MCVNPTDVFSGCLPVTTSTSPVTAAMMECGGSDALSAVGGFDADAVSSVGGPKDVTFNPGRRRSSGARSLVLPPGMLGCDSPEEDDESMMLMADEFNWDKLL